MRALRALALFAVVSAGCDWRTFDDLAKKTPVGAVEAPSGYAASGSFGPILLALDPPADKSSAGRFVATAVPKTSVAVVTFDAAGLWHGTGVTGSVLDSLGDGPITAVAAVPGGKKVMLGAPYTDLGDVLLMDQDPPYDTQSFHHIGESQYGVGVAAGNIGAGAAPELVVFSARTLHVYVDGQPGVEATYTSAGATDPCPIDFSASLPDADRASRPVLVAPLQGGAVQIAVGTPALSSAGHVSIFDVDLSTMTVTCAATLTATEPHFGRAMALVDADGTGVSHLLVGAPPTHAYLYALPLSAGQAPAATATDTETGGSFGAAVAAFDIDGKAGDEMFIGNPDGTVNGATTAGRVSIYTGRMLTALPAAFPNPLAEHEPKAGHGYGSGLAGMTFCPGNVVPGAADGGAADAGTTADGGVAACTHLPLVGSLSKVFAYYTLKKPDPRVK